MAFNEKLIQAVWDKGRATQDQDPTEWRKDQCGAWLFRAHYEDAESEYGWKIENVTPGGEDVLDNLHPFHWRNTYDIANDEPRCRVTADREHIGSTQRIDHPRNRDV